MGGHTFDDHERMDRFVTHAQMAEAFGRAETTLPHMDKDTRAGLVQAGRKVAEWTRERDSRIREAVRDGASLREVGEAVGLSHTAVKFIAHGRPSKP